MQWDKVKNILLVILLVVDGFLAISLFQRYIGTAMQQQALLSDLQVVLSRYEVACGDTLSIPASRKIIPLQVDRSRAGEETFAHALLSGTVQREEREDGETVFTGDNGTVSWRTDGTVYAVFAPTQPGVPASTHAKEKAAADLLSACGVTRKGSTLRVEADAVTLTATLAGMPVFNRALSVAWRDEAVTIEGRWSFGMPYATTADQERECSAEDALLQVARGEVGQEEVRRIDGMELGYRMDMGAGARLQLSPYWRITTDKGEIFVDALK